MEWRGNNWVFIAIVVRRIVARVVPWRILRWIGVIGAVGIIIFVVIHIQLEINIINKTSPLV